MIFDPWTLNFDLKTENLEKVLLLLLLLLNVRWREVGRMIFDLLSLIFETVTKGKVAQLHNL